MLGKDWMASQRLPWRRTTAGALVGALMEALVCCSGLHGCSALVGARVSTPIAALL